MAISHTTSKTWINSRSIMHNNLDQCSISTTIRKDINNRSKRIPNNATDNFILEASKHSITLIKCNRQALEDILRLVMVPRLLRLLHAKTTRLGIPHSSSIMEVQRLNLRHHLRMVTQCTMITRALK
jgi:hypothetical protein